MQVKDSFPTQVYACVPLNIWRTKSLQLSLSRIFQVFGVLSTPICKMQGCKVKVERWEVNVESWMLRGECWMLKDGGWEMKVESWKTAPTFTWVTPSSHSGEDAEGRRGLLWILQSTKENHKEAKRCNRIIIPPLHETPWESKICDRLASYSRLHDSKYIITRWKSAVILFFFSNCRVRTAFFRILTVLHHLAKAKTSQ